MELISIEFISMFGVLLSKPLPTIMPPIEPLFLIALESTTTAQRENLSPLMTMSVRNLHAMA
jgi:hypothetical protein